MAKWTRERYEWQVVEGTLEEMLKQFWCIEGNVRDYGLDVWLEESGRLPKGTPIAHATGNDLVAYACAHRARSGGEQKEPRREWKETLEGIELSPEEDVRLAQLMREWIRTRN